MRGMCIAGAVCLLAVAASGCAAVFATGPGPATAARAEAVEGAYSGIIPCADCPGIRYTLTLLPDSVAVRRMTYLEAENGEDVTHSELLLWRLANAQQLVLSGAAPNDQYLLVSGDSMLSMLDARGNRIESGLKYDLARTDTAADSDAPIRLRGYYSYMADAGLFIECGTRRSFPVLQEGDNVALERAYLAAVEQAGVPLFVSLEARVEMRPSMESSNPDELSIVPVRFGEVLKGAACGEIGGSRE